jgi:hypothetical protein
MSKTKNLLFVSLLLLVPLTLCLAQEKADVSGEWDFTMTTPRGEMTSTIKIVQEGEKITVTMPGRQGGEFTGTGTIKGTDIEWTITRETPRGEFTSTYKGTVEGNTMKGTTQMGERTMEWKATKKQA